MVNIENVDLRTRGVDLPSDRVGVVVAQPFLSLTPKEPFVCTRETAAAQLATIRKTLDIARARPHGQPKTHFTIFPEYSIPGLSGVAAVDAALGVADWPNGTLVIGGLTALTRDEYAVLVAMPNTAMNAAANGVDHVKAIDWLNCSIVWVKGANGAVEKWVQPKIYPAWTEQKVHYKNMFHGGSIFIFRGRLENGALYRFSTLICFDWIATVDKGLLWRQVLEDLAKQAEAAEAEYSLSWFFIIQHNEKPNHDAFLSQIPPFFDERSLPTVRRDRACVVFANTAGKPIPGKTDVYGGTSLVFSANTNFTKAECSPTFASGGPRFRNNSTILNPYYDVVFRERGACILSFVQVNPGAVATGPANRTIAVETAELFPIGATVDPRVPSAAVPASVKWLNDQLDDLPGVSAIFSTAALKANAAAAHDPMVTALRTTDAPAIADALALATDVGVKDADAWDVAEAAALSLLVNAMEILAIGFASQPMTAGAPLSTIAIGGHTLAVVTVKGRSHQSCLEHAAVNLPNTQHQCLLITKDQENTPWDRKEENFLKGDAPHLGMENKITDPNSNALHLSYQELLTVYRGAKTVNALQEAIHAKLA
jgi:hypothetical protein